MKSFLYKIAIKIKNNNIIRKVIKRINDKEKIFKEDTIPPAVINDETKTLIEKLRAIAKSIYGENWNYYSDAFKTEVAKNFEDSISFLQKLNRPINYLEIGSAQGLSMALNGSILNKKNIAGNLISLDPYFNDGYIEGEEAPWQTANLITIDKSTKENAARLYKEAGITVIQQEKMSFDGLLEFNNKKVKFDYIYIDGYHEKFVPMQDLALCLPLLNVGGIIMLDDHTGWPAVTFLKFICDKYLTKISESWKIVAYQKNQEL